MMVIHNTFTPNDEFVNIQPNDTQDELDAPAIQVNLEVENNNLYQSEKELTAKKNRVKSAKLGGGLGRNIIFKGAKTYSPSGV